MKLLISFLVAISRLFLHHNEILFSFDYGIQLRLVIFRLNNIFLLLTHVNLKYFIACFIKFRQFWRQIGSRIIDFYLRVRQFIDVFVRSVFGVEFCHLLFEVASVLNGRRLLGFW